jgi:hypothetical protein
MKAQRGANVQLYFSLTSALQGGAWSTPRPGRTSPRKETRWVGPRVGLDGCGKSRPRRDLIPGPNRPKRVAIPTELSRSTPLPLRFRSIARSATECCPLESQKQRAHNCIYNGDKTTIITFKINKQGNDNSRTYGEH